MNLSPQWNYTAIPDSKVALILAENQLDAEQLTLEVTESTLMQDPMKAKHELKLLDNLGGITLGR